jgi:hypothetical protein
MSSSRKRSRREHNNTHSPLLPPSDDSGRRSPFLPHFLQLAPLLLRRRFPRLRLLRRQDLLGEEEGHPGAGVAKGDQQHRCLEAYLLLEEGDGCIWNWWFFKKRGVEKVRKKDQTKISKSKKKKTSQLTQRPQPPDQVPNTQVHGGPRRPQVRRGDIPDHHRGGGAPHFGQTKADQ